MMDTHDKSTRDIDVGSRIDLPGFRGVIVASNDESGLGVIWYDDQGCGPHHAVLPHGKVQTVAYHDERNADRHYTEVHPDFTGKYGEV